MTGPAYSISKEVDFPQVDGRDYVQGVTILVRMLDAVMDETGQETSDVTRVKFVRRTLLNGIIKAAIGAGEPLDIADAGAIVHGSVASMPMTAAFYPDQKQPVSREETSPPYPFSDLEPAEPFGSRTVISCRDGAEFLWTLIEVNKQTIAHWVGDRISNPRIELVEATGFVYRRHGMADPGELEIANLNVREFGSRLYVLNEARYLNAEGEPQTLRLQYSASPR